MQTDTHTNSAEPTYKHAVLGCHNLWPCVDIPGGPRCVIQLSDLSDLKCHLLCAICQTHVSLWAASRNLLEAKNICQHLQINMLFRIIC